MTFASTWAFTVIAILCLLYSVVLYVWRVDKIRKRRDMKRIWYEKWGPTVLCLGLLLAVLVNFILRMKHGDIVADDNRGQNHQTITNAGNISEVRGLELWFFLSIFSFYLFCPFIILFFFRVARSILIWRWWYKRKFWFSGCIWMVISKNHVQNCTSFFVWNCMITMLLFNVYHLLLPEIDAWSVWNGLCFPGYTHICSLRRH